MVTVFMAKDLICIAEITGTHGVRGLVKLRCFADDPALLNGDHPVYNEAASRQFIFTKLSPHKQGYLAEIEGLTGCDQAKKLSKTKLYIERDILPKASDDEFYHIDLIGLNVQFENSQDIGIVNAVQDFGAGTLLEIKPEKGASFYIPFTLDAVPDVQIDKGYITIIPPNEISERD